MTPDPIFVRGLSKQYRLVAPRDSYPTLRDALVRTFARRSRKSRPAAAARRDDRQRVLWALRAVDLDVAQADVLGIIGRNGAGKSTFLKILAGITEPTEGYAEIRGRVGCLLEVGTGFHMELSGRDNIFMNGALLGLSRRDIRRRLDEIVAFAEIGALVDTPVKHYSSGLYMRLAFAVAAHLEPEILIVDEVLAVGDIEFQRKCLGKMQEVSRSQGRTILFVSHNMSAIRRLCTRCVLFDRGRIVASGAPSEVVDIYLGAAAAAARPRVWIDLSFASRTGTGEARFSGAWYSGASDRTGYRPCPCEPLELRLAIDSDSRRTIHGLAVTLHDRSGARLVNADIVLIGRTIELRPGPNVVGLRIKALYLNPGVYRASLWLANPRSTSSVHGVYDWIESAFDLEIAPHPASPLDRHPHAAVACELELLDQVPGSALGEAAPAAGARG